MRILPWMKKFLFAFLLLPCLLFAGCDVNDMTSLKDLSRPYTGEYECRKLLLGGEDLLSRFESVRLTLGLHGDFVLSYRDTEGGEGSFSGKYTLAGDTLTLRANAGGRELSYEFPYSDGKVIGRLQMGGKLLLLEFSMIG